jgi:hypothetical protein
VRVEGQTGMAAGIITKGIYAFARTHAEGARRERRDGKRERLKAATPPAQRRRAGLALSIDRKRSCFPNFARAPRALRRGCCTPQAKGKA